MDRRRIQQSGGAAKIGLHCAVHRSERPAEESGYSVGVTATAANYDNVIIRRVLPSAVTDDQGLTHRTRDSWAWGA
jgi:hypothetical protein